MTSSSPPPSKRRPLTYDEAVLAWLAGEDDEWWNGVRDHVERRAC